jgi:hypothetical protein
MPRANNGLKDYMNDLENVSVPEHLPEPVPNGLIHEDVPELPKRRVFEQNQPQPLTLISESQETFYKTLLERLQKLETVAQQVPLPVSVMVETTEAHVERLLKLEKTMISMINESTGLLKTDFVEIHAYLKEELVRSKEEMTCTRTVLNGIVETQYKITESLSAMTSAIMMLSGKVADIITNQPTPVINIPAPIVNITESSGGRRVTKHVQRDENGLITKVVEDSVQPEPPKIIKEKTVGKRIIRK